MKGLDPEIVADAFMLEAVKLTFGFDDPEAARLVQRWKEQTFRLLDADYVIRPGADGGPKVVRLLRCETRERLLSTTGLTPADSGWRIDFGLIGGSNEVASSADHCSG